jgi:hypothetical protein
MTEAEWLACDYPLTMLDFVRGRLSNRQLRLIGCAFCRDSWWQLLSDQRSRRAVEVAEGFADGLCDDRALREAHAEASRASHELHARHSVKLHLGAIVAKMSAAKQFPWRPLCNTGITIGGVDVTLSRKVLAIRDVVGNPFQRAAVDPKWLAWKDGTIRKIATGIYAERAFDHLPILADALEDAGCDNADILAHCRGPGPHVHGCWVVDQILGKE